MTDQSHMLKIHCCVFTSISQTTIYNATFYHLKLTRSRLFVNQYEANEIGTGH